MTRLQPKESLASIEEIDASFDDTISPSSIIDNECLWDEIVSQEIKQSYIRQNLPVRRQSLQVYHSQSHSTLLIDMKQQERQDEQKKPKRHSSLNFTSFFNKKSDPAITPTRSKSTLVGSPRSRLHSRFSLLKGDDDITSPEMETLFEEGKESPKQPVQRFIGIYTNSFSLFLFYFEGRYISNWCTLYYLLYLILFFSTSTFSFPLLSIFFLKKKKRIATTK
jgi:hypothetical protein